ncbi:MAG TPA: ZIP family metal transporter [Gaiellaceae bacterium]|nr:ZIP family metal transporter [Gaiellaceae bacterium]
MSWVAIPLSLLTVVSTLIGGLTALRMRAHLETVMALSGGVVVAVALFDVLPEAINGIENSRTVTTLVAAGFLTFFFFQRALVLHHRDDPDEARAHHRVGALGAAALSVHSFIDGLGIGLAFGVSTLTGVLVFVAVISHDFADGLNTVTFVLRQQGDRRRALRWLAADAAAPFFGAIVGTIVSVSAQNLAYLLAVYAGFFLYVGSSDLLPAAHARTSPLRIALTLAGFAATYAIVTVASH